MWDRRAAGEVVPRMLEQIGRLEFKDFVTRMDALHVMPFADIIRLLAQRPATRRNAFPSRRAWDGQLSAPVMRKARGFALLIAASSRIDRVGDRDGSRRTVPCHVAW